MRWRPLDAQGVTSTVDIGSHRLRILGSLVGVGLGLALALLHWIGFLLAGVVLGVMARSLREAVAGAGVVGVVVAVGMLGSAWWYGHLEAFIATGALAALALAIPLALLLLGSLVRGLF